MTANDQRPEREGIRGAAPPDGSLSARDAGIPGHGVGSGRAEPAVAPPPDPELQGRFLEISRLLAGQLDFSSAIRSVADEVARVLAYDHFDVCIAGVDGRFHSAYESGIETAWGSHPHAPVANSPIRALLSGEVDHILADDACTDARFHFDGAFVQPIIDHELRSRLHVPMVVHGDIIGALSCSQQKAGQYRMGDVRNARAIADLLSPYFFALRAAEQARQSAIVETEARAREEGLRLGALALTEALESERQRIGMDLHDQTLADLTRLTRRLDQLARSAPSDGLPGTPTAAVHLAQSATQPDAPSTVRSVTLQGDARGQVPADPEPVGKPSLADMLDPITRGLQRCMHDLRQIIEQAKPSVLHLFGFAQAVENLLERSVRDSGQTLDWRLDDASDGVIDTLDPSVSMALFRITQEAINNAVHHADATMITVRLSAQGGQLSIEVFDDGKGIARRRSRIGSGIDNMKTRARLISARFAIGPAPVGPEPPRAAGGTFGTAGPGTSGPGTSGPGVAGPGTAGPGTSGPGVAGPGTSGPGTSGPGTSGPGMAGDGPGGAGLTGAGVTGAGVAGAGAAGGGTAISVTLSVAPAASGNVVTTWRRGGT